MNYHYDKNFAEAFGARVRRLRIEQGYSMRTFADLAEMEYSHLSRIEFGQVNASIGSAYSISKALKLPVKDLFNFEL